MLIEQRPRPGRSAAPVFHALREFLVAGARRISQETALNLPSLLPNLPDSRAADRSPFPLKFSCLPVLARSLLERSRSASLALRRGLPLAPVSTSARARFRLNPATGTFHPRTCGTSSREKSSAVSIFSFPSPTTLLKRPPCCCPTRATPAL